MNIILARLTRARETRRGGHGHLATPKCPISLNRRVAIPSIDAWRSPPSVNTPRGVGGKPLLLRQWLPMTVKHLAGVGGKGRRSVPTLASQEEHLVDLHWHHAHAALLTSANAAHGECPSCITLMVTQVQEAQPPA